MKKFITNEITTFIIAVLPFLYLMIIWKELPERVPVHWNIEGKIDRYGSKNELVLVSLLLPFLTYLIFLIVPKIDPKNKINKMGSKYGSLKFYLVLLMSIIAIFIILSAKNSSLFSSKYLLVLLGMLFIILGNYMKTMKPNYFIGIRTPWTLENEQVWKATHKKASILWFIGGLLIVIFSLTLNQKLSFITFVVITLVISFYPVIYSYFKYKALKNK